MAMWINQRCSCHSQNQSEKGFKTPKRRVMVKPVDLLCSSEETGCGVSTPLLVMVNYATETEGDGWCWQR